MSYKFFRLFTSLMLALAIAFAGVTPAAADPLPKVAVYAADELEFVDEVISKLTATGLFSQVDNLSPVCCGEDPTPTLATLQQYAAVMVWSDYLFNDSTALGDVLADYVDAGGHVVVSSLALGDQPESYIAGRFDAQGYLPVTRGFATCCQQVSLVADLPNNSLLAGVNSLDGGSGSHRNYSLSLVPGATLVAHWSDGQPLVAYKPNVVALNFFPPSSDSDPGFWNSTTDGVRLMTNALSFSPPLVIPPNNDDFAGAEDINSLPFSATVDITEATNEQSEPQACPLSMDKTVWYSFTPAQNMWVSMNTQGSTISSKVQAYHSAAPGIENLEFLNCASFGVERTFFAEAGQKYYLQVGSLLGEAGNIQFNLSEVPPPANDNFADAQAMDYFLPGSVATNLDISTATNESGSGEPQNCFTMDKTVWYSFTPAQNTVLHMNTDASAISSNVNAYLSVAPGINNLTFLQCANSGNPSTLFAEAGQKYYLQFGSTSGGVGNIQLNLQGTVPPTNDNFANAKIIPALPFDDTMDTLTSTIESGEPTPSCAFYGLGSRSIWYAFTPTTSATISAYVPYISFAPVSAAYSGNSLTGLTEIGCAYAGNRLSFHVDAGITYYFQVSNLYPWEQGGTLEFHLDAASPPQANFYFYPYNPSAFDTIQFYDQSYDPAQLGFQSFTWDFGDGATSTDTYPTHKYSADGDYTIQHSVTTNDGRTASTSQVVQIRTHDVSLTKVEAPEDAKVGKSEKITVSVLNTSAYAESVRVDLYRSVAGGGFEFVGTLTKNSAVNPKGDKPTKFIFNYTFVAGDAAIGKVIFRAVASIENAPDAFPQDNERLSSLTIVKKKK